MPHPFEQHFWLPPQSTSLRQAWTHDPMLLIESFGHCPGLVVGSGAIVVTVIKKNYDYNWPISNCFHEWVTPVNPSSIVKITSMNNWFLLWCNNLNILTYVMSGKMHEFERCFRSYWLIITLPAKLLTKCDECFLKERILKMQVFVKQEE